MLKRIKQYIDYKHINISNFEKSIGMSNSSFGKSLKNGGAIGTDKLENILNVYPDINPVWLLTGKGEMICDENQEENTTDPLTYIMNRYESLAIEHGYLKKENETLREAIKQNSK